GATSMARRSKRYRCSAGELRLRAILGLTAQRGLRVVEGDELLEVVAQREAIAGRLRRTLAAETLVQEPVHPFVAVEEADHVARRAERDALGEPDEPQPLSGHALRAVGHGVTERKERFGQTDDDGPRLVVRLGRQMWAGAIAQRPKGDLVAFRVGESSDQLPEFRRRDARMFRDQIHSAA